MVETAVHLVDRIFLDVDVRQSVLTVARPLRLVMAMDAWFRHDSPPIPGATRGLGSHIRASMG